MGRADLALQAAGLAAQAGDWRLCADKYLEAYNVCSSDWPAKFCCWSGYTSVLREDHFKATDADLTALRKVRKDENAPLLDRKQASFAQAYVLKEHRGDRPGAARNYRRTIDLCTSATAADRERQVLLPDAATMKYTPTSCGPLFDRTLKTAKENLASMEDHSPGKQPLPFPISLYTAPAPASRATNDVMRDVIRRGHAITIAITIIIRMRL